MSRSCSKRRCSAATAAVVLISTAACSQDDPLGPAGGLLSLTVTPTEIAVGLDSLVTVVVRRTGADDDDGDRVLLQASAGTFMSSSGNGAAIIRRLAGDSTRVYFAPPTTVGDVLLTVAGQDSESETILKVTSAPPPGISGLPAQVAPGTTVTVAVTADAAWRNRVVELRASGGTLTALGPVEGDGATSGNMIRPLLSSQGTVSIQWTAPSASGPVVITADLFRSTTTGQVTVQAPAPAMGMSR